MFEIVKAFRDALGIDATWSFVVIVATIGAVTAGSLAWIVDTAYRNTLAREKAAQVVTAAPVAAPPATQDSAPGAVADLQPYANGLANVKIILWSNAHRALSDRIASVFELAGWDVNYNRTAQEAHNPHHFSGIEVRGFNGQLVNVAAKSVRRLGGWDVRTSLEELKVPKDNPKWPVSQQTVYITIGYPNPLD